MRWALNILKLIIIIFIEIPKYYEKYPFVLCNISYMSNNKTNGYNKVNKNGFTFLNVINNNYYKNASKLYMTKKFKYKYKNSLEKRIRKGRIRNEINQKLKKKNSAYMVITEKLSKLDPDQIYFKYDKNILKEYENIKDIYKNKKLGRKFNLFDYWYSSNKKEAKYNYSRHVNYTITENKFNFKNVFSYFHILEVVHERFKNNAFYINGLQSFINKYYDPVTGKRVKSYDRYKESLEMMKNNDKGNENDKKHEKNNMPMNTIKKDSKKNNEEKQRNDEIKSKKDIFEMMKESINDFQCENTVNEDSSFKLFGSSTSCLLKKNAPIAYDIKNPFMKSKLSSKRRRFKERKLFDIINFKCKNRQERLMQTAVRKLAKKKLKNEKYILDGMTPA
ncbi:conserved Plasmodium protein, unknown function [Plasmodium vinckei vinckei]|uniref:Protein AMR3 n=1 Tax=Plasmodium vinckei vinckei TaxID=54757 RepID=A0A449BZJ9_PLAVN|nr:conserved Plasmodium protein, unknown function [Plasmodium vinckei vinckei]VEV58812.1 conserved Plasmodium protein, unknown function [Plasmodium vinckei vinckei]